MKETLPRQVFTAEFRQQAVELILREGLSIAEAARRLSISPKTLANWVGMAKRGVLPSGTTNNAATGDRRREVTEEESELSRLRRENAELRMERDILKNVWLRLRGQEPLLSMHRRRKNAPGMVCFITAGWRASARRKRFGHTLQTTALINEAYLRLIEQQFVKCQSRAHYFAISVHLMRRTPVDRTRSHTRAKGGGGVLRVSLNEAVVPSQKRVAELVTLDDALIVGDTPDIAFDGRRRVVAQLKIFQHSLA